ncbi:MAG: oligosaccharide flippase family protein [Clostridia bacterium]|nr:oligosaccharide flippase family protein [Clostridia bacterium]
MKRIKVFIFNTIILMFTGIILRILTIYFNIYISNKIGTEMLGVFQLIMSVYLFGITLANFGINLSSTRVVAENLALNNINGTKKVAKYCLYFSLISGICASIIFYVFRNFILTNCLHSKVSEEVIYLLCLALPLISMSNAINGYFAGIRKVYKNSLAQFFEQISKIIVTAFFLNLFLPKGINYACISLIIGDLVSEIFSFIFIYILYLFEIKKDYSKKSTYIISDKNETYSKEILRISLPVAITSYIRSGLSTLKQLIIPSSLEKSGSSCANALSTYGIINGMSLPIIMFPDIFIKSFSNLLIPEFSRYFAKKDFKRAKQITLLLLFLTGVISLFITAFLFIFSTPLGLKLYNNPYSGYYIKLLAPLAFFIYVDTVVDSILRGLDAQVGVMIVNIFDLIISSTFIFFFVPKLGVNGYIISIYISEIFNFSCSIYQLYKLMHNA